MAKSKVQVSNDLSSGEEEDTNSDTTADDDDVDDEAAAEMSDEGDEAPGSDVDDDEEGSISDQGGGTEEEPENADDKDPSTEGREEEPEEAAENPDNKSGLADVMAKILRKQAPDNKPVIMSKALTDKELRLKRKSKEATQTDDLQVKKRKSQEDDSSSSDEDYGATSREQYLKKKAWEELGRRKVDITQREPERQLQKIATKGVLQLFNAVAKQQKMIEDKLRAVGGSERKKEDVMKSMSKGAFLDMLKTTPNVSDEPVESRKKLVKKKPVKGEESDSENEDDNGEGKPSWNILRDDFMMGAKMKDWDKEDDDIDSNHDAEPDDDSSGSES